MSVMLVPGWENVKEVFDNYCKITTKHAGSILMRSELPQPLILLPLFAAVASHGGWRTRWWLRTLGNAFLERRQHYCLHSRLDAGRIPATL